MVVRVPVSRDETGLVSTAGLLPVRAAGQLWSAPCVLGLWTLQFVDPGGACHR